MRVSPDEMLVFDERLKLGSSRDGQVQGFGCEEGFDVKQVEVVVVNQICEQLVAEAMQGGHDREAQVPASIRGPVHHPEGGGRHSPSGKQW